MGGLKDIRRFRWCAIHNCNLIMLIEHYPFLQAANDESAAAPNRIDNVRYGLKFLACLGMLHVILTSNNFFFPCPQALSPNSRRSGRDAAEVAAVGALQTGENAANLNVAGSLPAAVRFALVYYIFDANRLDVSSPYFLPLSGIHPTLCLSN
jgi:hypothetical protein